MAMVTRFRPIAWILLGTFVMIAAVYGSRRAYRHGLAAADRQYEYEALAHVQRQLGQLTPGMSWPAVRQVVFGGVRNNPRHGDPLDHFIDNDWGIRRDVIRMPDHRFLVLEYGPNHAAPLDSTGTPQDDAGWQLLRFGQADQPWLKPTLEHRGSGAPSLRAKDG
jgi:hypothetical protein